MEAISIVVIVFAILIILSIIGLKLYSSIKLKGLRQTAIDLIVNAEEAFDKGMNNEKFQAVVDGIIDCLPPVAKLFINEATIKMFVQAVFDSIKAALDVQSKLPEENKEEEIEESVNDTEAKG